MSDERDTNAGADQAPDGDPPEAERAAEGEASRRSARGRVSDGFQKGLGVLSAFKDALEETIAEARERGDLSTDRAKEVFRGAVGRAREATHEARERFDFVSQQEFDELVKRVAELEARVRDRLGEGPGRGGPGDGGATP